MFAAVVRGAAGFGGSMLVISVIASVINPHVLPYLQDGSLLKRSLEGTVTWLPLIALIAVLMALIARGLAESEVR